MCNNRIPEKCESDNLEDDNSEMQTESNNETLPMDRDDLHPKLNSVITN